MLRTSQSAAVRSQCVRSAPAPPRSGDLTLLGDYADAISAILALLARPALPEAALRTGIREVIAERLPAAAGDRIRPGSTWGEAAAMIADLLRSQHGTATDLFSRLAGEPVWMKAGEFTETPLGADLAAELDAAPGTVSWHRPGQFTDRAGLVADTEVDLIPGLIPPEAMERIGKGQPCGPVLVEFGMRRQSRDARTTGGDPAVEASAKLRIGEVTVGRAAERVPLAFCERVAEASWQGRG